MNLHMVKGFSFRWIFPVLPGLPRPTFTCLDTTSCVHSTETEPNSESGDILRHVLTQTLKRAQKDCYMHSTSNLLQHKCSNNVTSYKTRGGFLEDI